MTFWETIERGEYVMFALAVIFILTIIIWWVVAARLKRNRKRNHSMMQRVRDHIVEGDVENTIQLCQSYATPGSRVIEAGLSHVGKPIQDVKSALSDQVTIEKENSGASMRWLRMFAVISPLAGLGGTLVGVTDRLRDLGNSGLPVTVADVCGELAPTIVTTIAGLGVGIFALFALTCLETTVGKSRRNLDEIALEFTDLLNEPS